MASKSKPKPKSKPKSKPKPKPKPKPKSRSKAKAAKAKAAKPATTAAATTIPVEAPNSPRAFRARVRMYRHGLGDCFLLSFPRSGNKPLYNILIDCGALAVDKMAMQQMVAHIRDTLKAGGGTGQPRLDLVVATHEHKDHLSGFNQARKIFNDEIEIGAVWMGWTENLTRNEVKKIKAAKKKVATKLQAALAGPAFAGVAGETGKNTSAGVKALLAFNSDDDSTGERTIGEALEYLKSRGEAAGALEYLEPGAGPLTLPDVDGVRVFVLGPPRDPILLKGSEVTERMKQDGVIYHLAGTGDLGVETLAAAAGRLATADGERFHPFAPEYRIGRKQTDPHRGTKQDNPYFKSIAAFVKETYDNPKQAWRKIDEDWLSAFGQLALDLDSDTNNTSLVLAFEFVKTGEVLLFVGDAQVGNWRSWASLEFTLPGRATPMPAHDLVARTVFYKVGHHCSHNATLKAGGLELMNRKDLVAFIPLREDVARNQGTKGWDMPAGPLFKALRERTEGRVVISDVTKDIPPEAIKAGVRHTTLYVDYFLQ